MLLKKVVGRSRFYDLFHKGWVNTCVGVTLVSFAVLGVSNFKALMDNRKKEKSVSEETVTDLASTITQKEGELL